MTDCTAIIATLFDPPTLAPLVDAFREEGCKVIIIRGKRTNEAWMEGLKKTKTRYVMIVNDDVEVYPKRGFVGRLLAHHAKGYTHILPTMWRSLNAVSPHGTGVQMGTGWKQSKSLVEIHAMDKGHFISMDRIVKVPPIPEDLTVYYGDDWFYWHHDRMGRCGVATDVQVRTGQDLDRDGFEGTSGWTQEHADVEKLIGEPLDTIARREHKIAPRYFSFYMTRPNEKLRGWYGFSNGLADADSLLRIIYANTFGMHAAVMETMERFDAYDGPLDCVVDLGANWGALPIYAVMRGAKRVIAVEADPENMSIMRENFEKFGVADRIECIEAAIDGETGKILPWRAIGTSGQRSTMFGDLPRQIGSVTTLGFADFIKSVGQKIDYLKVDIEGGEHTFLLPDEATREAFSKVGFLDLEYHGNGHELFDNGPLTKEIEARTHDVLESIGVPERGWVAHGEVCVA